MTARADEIRTGPNRASHEELLLSPVGALRRYTDRDGRPLCGEAAVDDADFRATLEQRRCPYAGSRRSHALPMNVSALRQMTRNWDTILALAGALRRLMTDGGPVDGTALPFAIDGRGHARAVDDRLVLAMRVAYAGLCLPLYLLYRGRGAMANGEVPGAVSGLHKASIDIATSAQLLLLDSFRGEGARTGRGDVDDLLDFVEREGLLIGPRGVCAGPPHLIREIVERMVDGGGETDADYAALGELGGLRAYVDELTGIWIGKHLVNACHARLLDRLDGQSRAAGLERWRAPDVEAELRAHRARAGHPALVSHVIARQERAARALDQAGFDRLLAALARAAGSLSWGAESRHAAAALLAHARGQGGPEPAGLPPELHRLAGGRAPDFVLAALVEAARTDQLALRCFAASEPGIRAALGIGGSAPALTGADLAAVFGILPRVSIGAAIGVDSTVDARAIVFRAAVAPAPADEPARAADRDHPRNEEEPCLPQT